MDFNPHGSLWLYYICKLRPVKWNENLTEIYKIPPLNPILVIDIKLLEGAGEVFLFRLEEIWGIYMDAIIQILSLYSNKAVGGILCTYEVYSYFFSWNYTSNRIWMLLYFETFSKVKNLNHDLWDKFELI